MGQSATRTVTFTNHDEQSVVIGAGALTGSPSLAIASDGCVSQTLAHGATHAGSPAAHDAAPAAPAPAPAAEVCHVAGAIEITTADFAKATYASAASGTTVARVSTVKVAAGEVKAVKLRTTLGSGTTLTSRQKTTVVLPRAAKKAGQGALRRLTGM